VKCGIIPGHAQLRGQIREWRQGIRAGVAKTSSLSPGATEVPISASKKARHASAGVSVATSRFPRPAKTAGDRDRAFGRHVG